MQVYDGNGHWFSEVPMDPVGSHGFIYCITNMLTGVRYIGRKSYYRKLTKPPLRGKKRKRVTYPESNWKTYTGSSDRLNDDIEEYGKSNFRFEMLFNKPAKGELSYAEVNLMHKCDVLTATLEDGTRAFYNGLIPAVKFIPKSGGLPLETVINLKARWAQQTESKKHE